MPSQSAESSNDQLFCWEQVLKFRPLFRVTQVFAPADLKNRLLPLHALFALVEAAGSQYSEEDLARGKLGWWRLELLGRGTAASAHPVLRELERSGAGEQLPADAIRALLDGAERRLEAAPPADLGELMTVCRETQEPQRALEEAVSGLPPETPHGLDAADVEAGLLQLARESTRRPAQDAFWWLPLQLLAKHGISRQDFARSRGAGAAADVLDEIREQAARDVRAASDERVSPASRPVAARHLAVSGLLTGRQLRRVPGLAPEDWSAALSTSRLGDLLAAWRTARRYAD
jgi:phytoene synthase